MKDSGLVDQFLYQAMNVVNQIRSYGDDLINQKVFEKIHRSLPRKFDAIEESKDLTIHFIDELMGSLLSHESRMNRNINSSLDNSFRSKVSFGRGRGTSNYRERGRGKSIDRCVTTNQEDRTNQSIQSLNKGCGRNTFQHPSSWFDKSQIQCHYFKRFDHSTSECRKKQEEIENNSANYSDISHNNLGSLFITCNVSQESSSDIWFLDSGCSNHMTRNKDLFTSLDDSIQFEVNLGNDSKVPIMGKGVINVLTKNGERRLILDVYFMPRLKHNLMSVGQIL